MEPDQSDGIKEHPLKHLGRCLRDEKVKPTDQELRQHGTKREGLWAMFDWLMEEVDLQGEIGGYEAAGEEHTAASEAADPLSEEISTQSSAALEVLDAAGLRRLFENLWRLQERGQLAGALEVLSQVVVAHHLWDRDRCSTARLARDVATLLAEEEWRTEHARPDPGDREEAEKLASKLYTGEAWANDGSNCPSRGDSTVSTSACGSCKNCSSDGNDPGSSSQVSEPAILMAFATQNWQREHEADDGEEAMERSTGYTVSHEWELEFIFQANAADLMYCLHNGDLPAALNVVAMTREQVGADSLPD